jgi:N-acetylglucosamine kinase-like BadF-type ATPase
MCDAIDLPYFVYAPTTHTDDIAAHCTIVIQAAEEGDAVAREILESEARELALAIIAVARRLGFDGAFPVAYTGGAFRAGELLLAPLRSALLQEAPLAQLRPAHERPVIGAARMAIAAASSARPSRRRA